jgi:hypothetical protein
MLYFIPDAQLFLRPQHVAHRKHTVSIIKTVSSVSTRALFRAQSVSASDVTIATVIWRSQRALLREPWQLECDSLRQGYYITYRQMQLRRHRQMNQDKQCIYRRVFRIQQFQFVSVV